MKRQNRLGRGLDILLDPGRRRDASAAEAPPVVEAAIDALSPGRYQPRRRLSEEALSELADSIREQGVLQPLVVRPATAAANENAGEFEIVAGERRWRAAKLAGLRTVPVVVRELDDQSALAVALIENLQREDLNPIDQAHSLSQLAVDFDLTHEQVAKAVGRSRATVSNLLRLLELHDEVKEMLADGRIDMGHARAMLSLDRNRQVALARRAHKRSLSVRQVEKAVRDLLDDSAATRSKGPTDLQTHWLQRQLANEIGRSIAIRPARGGGYSFNASFKDLSELQRMLEHVQRLVGQLRDAAGPRARDGS